MEGNGSVHHLALSGDYLPIGEIRTIWTRQTGGTQLNLQLVVKFKTWYLEMTRQQKLWRYSQSRGWTWPGAGADWKSITRRNVKWDPELRAWKFNTKTAVRRWQEVIEEKRQGALPVETSPRPLESGGI
jgi:hypothetical protein